MDEKFQSPVPAWIRPEHWQDIWNTHLDQRGPDRRVSRSKLVRMARATLGQFGPFGWTWCLGTVVGTAVLVQGWSFWYMLLTVVAVLAWANLGRLWAARNNVMGFTVICECGRELDELDGDDR